MDRWFRSVSDFYKVQDVLDEYGTKWAAVAEPNINMETRDGRLNLNIMLSIGQNEVDTTSERIRFTVNSMIQNGRIVWGDANLPLGYKIETDGKAKKIIKDPETEPMVREFFDYFRKYGAKRRTVIHMQDMFGIDFSYTMLKRCCPVNFISANTATMSSTALLILPRNNGMRFSGFRKETCVPAAPDVFISFPD